MVFENRKKANNIKFLFLLLVPVYLIILVMSIFMEFFEGFWFQIAWTAAFLVIYAFLLMRGLNYIYLNTKTDKIIFRYVTLNPITKIHTSIEIPKVSFAKYEIKKILSGFKTNIIFYQTTHKGTAPYDPVSITTMTKDEIESIRQELDKYVKKV